MERWIRAPILVGLCVLSTSLLGVLHIRGQDSAPAWTLGGETDQGHVIRLRLDAKGRVQTFELRASEQCSTGRLTSSGWHPSGSGAPARFRSRGPRLQATEFRRFEHADGSVSTANAELRGRVSKLGASGTVRLNNTYRWPDGRHEECESGRVAWTAH
jgi:hypothetical protein